MVAAPRASEALPGPALGVALEEPPMCHGAGLLPGRKAEAEGRGEHPPVIAGRLLPCV